MNVKEILKKNGWIIAEVLFFLVIWGYLQYIYSVYSMPTAASSRLIRCVLLVALAILIGCGRKWNKIILYISLLIYSLYFITQQIYYRGFGQYYRFATAVSLKDEVIGASSSALELVRFSDLIPLIILSLIMIVFGLIAFKYYPKLNKLSVRILIRLALSFCIMILAVGTFKTYTHEIEQSQNGVDPFSIYQTDYYIYTSIPNTVQFVDKFAYNFIFILFTERKIIF